LKAIDSSSPDLSVVASFSIGPIEIGKDHVWQKDCLIFWQGQPSMKKLLTSLNRGHDENGVQNITLENAIHKFVKNIDEWANKYNFPVMKLIYPRQHDLKQQEKDKEENNPTRSDEEKQEEKTKPTQSQSNECGWLVDTASVDVSYMNASLCKFGYPPLHYYWGKYQDVANIDTMINRLLGALFILNKNTSSIGGIDGKNGVKTIGDIAGWLKKHPDAPSNNNAHDAESDAIYILQRYCFCSQLFSDLMK
jgi:hypothetical protein